VAGGRAHILAKGGVEVGVVGSGSATLLLTLRCGLARWVALLTA